MSESYSHTKNCMICNKEFQTNRPDRQHYCSLEHSVEAQRVKKRILSALSRGASTAELYQKFGRVFVDYILEFEEASITMRHNVFFDFKDENRITESNFALRDEWKLPTPAYQEEEKFDRDAYFALVGIKPNG